MSPRYQDTRVGCTSSLFFFIIVVALAYSPRFYHLAAQEISPFSPVLIRKGEKISTPSGTFFRSPDGFMETQGVSFRGPPPDSLPDGVGGWNNQCVEKARAGFRFANPDTLKLSAQCFDDAIRKDPWFFPFLFNAGLIAARAHQHAKAIVYFRRAIFRFPQYGAPWLELGKSLFATGRVVEAKESFNRAARLPGSGIEPYLILSRMELNNGAPDHALGILDRLPDTLKENPEVSLLRAKILIRKESSRERMSQGWRIIRRLSILSDEDVHNSGVNREAQFLMATRFESDGEMVQAMDLYTDLASLPDSHPFHQRINRVMVLRRMKNLRAYLPVETPPP